MLNKAAGAAQPPSEARTGPGIPRTLGLRARSDGRFILSQAGPRKETDHVVFLVV